MHMMSFGDAFGWLCFMVFMLAMLACVAGQRALKNPQVRGETSRVGGIAGGLLKGWLKKRYGGK
jgi:hypothetical protein